MSVHPPTLRLRVRLLLPLVLVGVGCREAPLGPYTPVSAAPSGLLTTLAVIPAYQAALPERAAIIAAGDSVVTIAALAVSGCVDYAAQAGLVGGTVIVTVVSRSPDVPRVCTLNAASATFRAVVHSAPRGRYDVVLRERIESASQAPSEREIVRQSVALR